MVKFNKNLESENHCIFMTWYPISDVSDKTKCWREARLCWWRWQTVMACWSVMSPYLNVYISFGFLLSLFSIKNSHPSFFLFNFYLIFLFKKKFQLLNFRRAVGLCGVVCRATDVAYLYMGVLVGRSKMCHLHRGIISCYQVADFSRVENLLR